MMSHRRKVPKETKNERRLEITLSSKGQIGIKPRDPFTVAELQAIANGITRYAGGITISPKPEPEEKEK